jgi:hypothetical protein
MDFQNPSHVVAASPDESRVMEQVRGCEEDETVSGI